MHETSGSVDGPEGSAGRNMRLESGHEDRNLGVRGLEAKVNFGDSSFADLLAL